MFACFTSCGTRPHPYRRVLLTIGLAAALPTAAVLGSPTPASADTVVAVPADASRDAFYGSPGLPTSSTQPGTLIRYQPVGTSQFRIMYWTQHPVVESGVTQMVTVPATALVNKPTLARPANGYPVIAWDHGTAGFNTNCATSFHPSTAFYGSWMMTPNAWSVAPDYVGLGVDPGLRSTDKDHWYFYAGFVFDKPFDRTSHPYLSRDGTGRTTLDAVRATRKLDIVLSPAGTSLGGRSRTLVIGISEGGHAALSTGEVYSTGYATDEVELKAIVAGAPVSDIVPAAYEPEVIKFLTASLIVGRSLEHKDIRPVNLLSDWGKWAYANANEDSCTKDPWSPLPGLVSGYPLKNGIAYPDLSDSVKQPAMTSALEAVRVGSRIISVPVLVSQVEKDPIVLPEATNQMVTRIRSHFPTTPVTHCTYAGADGNLLARMDNHATSIDKVRAGTGGTCTGLPAGVPSSPTLTQWLTAVGANFTL